MSDQVDQTLENENAQLEAGDEPELIESGDDLAAKALASVSGAAATSSGADDDEIAASDEIAQTLEYLQNIIERNAEELGRIKGELRNKRESLRSVFENDTTLAEAEEQARQVSAQVKERKVQLKNSPQASQIKTHIADLSEQAKEIEETLSGHLLNYYTLTNSTSFDTSDGDQWEFKIQAKVKARKS